MMSKSRIAIPEMEEEDLEFEPLDEEEGLAAPLEAQMMSIHICEDERYHPLLTHGHRGDSISQVTVPHKSAFDVLLEGVPKPKGYLPEKILPAWPDHPLSKKLPTGFAPKDYFYYSRGAVGEKLHRDSNVYTLADPNNQETVVALPYSPLHSVHAVNYYTKSVVNKKLVKDGIVSKANKAVCSLKEFNKYRQYLFKRIYVEDVKSALQNKDAHDKAIQNIETAAKRDMAETSGIIGKQKHRQKAAKEKHQKKMTDKAIAAMDLCRIKEENYARYLHQKKSVKAERRAAYMERELNALQNKKNLDKARMDARTQLLQKIVTGEKANAERVKQEKELIKRTAERFHMEWMDAKLEYQKKIVADQKIITQAIAISQAAHAAKRLERVERHRAALPAIIERQKAEYKRLWALVRKYFNRWRENIAKRKASRPDENHLSSWNIPVVLEKQVEGLRKESGYEKLDDFIMGIVALKKRIKAELEAEEAAEAAEDV